MKSVIRLSFLAGALFAAATASATTYSFTNIIDSTFAAPNGNYFGFADATISGHKVAFKASYDQGFLGTLEGIFTSAGGPRTPVAAELGDAPIPPGGLWTAVGRPTISGNSVHSLGSYSDVLNNVVDEGDFIFQSNGFFRAIGPAISSRPFALAPNLPTIPYTILADPLITDGPLAFRASTSSPSVPDTLYTQESSGGATRIVGHGDPAPLGGVFSSIDAIFGVSGNTVAFRGFSGGQEGIFTGSGGALTTIAKEGDATPVGGTFTSLLVPSISGDTVAFRGNYSGGSGVFAGSGGALTTIVKTGDLAPEGDTFTSFPAHAISGDTVVFRGSYSGGGGIYTKSNVNLSTVIKIGDPLFGSTVSSLFLGRLGVDSLGSGNLAFVYGLANGQSGVALAHLEPTLYSIYEWEAIDPQNPLDGRRQGSIPIVDSAGLVALPVVNLAQRNLTKAHLVGAELQGANANHANLTNADLQTANLTNADLSFANLSNAVLDAARLDGANFTGADVRGTHFRTISITRNPCTQIFCTPTTTSYGGISPAQLAATASYAAHDLSAIDLGGNIFTDANLAGQSLTAANFNGTLLNGADLTGANIQGANFGRYTVTSGCEGKPAINSCKTVTDTIGTGISVLQLTSSASYVAHDLSNVDFSGNILPGVNLTGQNLSGASLLGADLTNAVLTHAILTNANIGSATPTGADLSGADARGSILAEASLSGAVTSNLIRADGHVTGVDLGAGQELTIRDFDGNSDSLNASIPIKFDQHFTIAPSGKLSLVLEADDWGSTISFAPGIPVALSGTLELAFAPGVDLDTQIGRTFSVFDWTAVTHVGGFTVDSDYQWDLSKLLTTGEIIFLAASGLPGDFNGDQVVDAADYTTWRDNLSSRFTSNAYDVWKSHFTGGSGAAMTSFVPTVPEPSSLLLAATCGLGFIMYCRSAFS